MTETELKARTKAFAARVLRLVDALPRTRAGRIIGDQLGRCGTSVGANYRAACRGKSRADFNAKLAIVEEEADESMYWMELIIDGGHLKAARVKSLYQEADEIVAIMVASRRTVVHNTSQAARPNQKSKIKNQK